MKSKDKPQGMRDPCSSAQVTSIFKVRGLWEASHSAGDAGHRRSQRASLGTVVYRVVRWFTFGNSEFPSWPQSIWGNSGNLTATVQLQYIPEYTVVTFSRQVRSGQWEFQVGQGVPDWPNSLLSYKDKESAKSSQLTALALQARTWCRLPGGPVGGELYHHSVSRTSALASSTFLCITASASSHWRCSSLLLSIIFLSELHVAELWNEVAWTSQHMVVKYHANR